MAIDPPIRGHVLVEVVHPADVLFFRRPIGRLLEQGHRVTVASRHKDVTVPMLEQFGIPHLPISRQGTGLTGLALELALRNWRLLRLARKDRPDVMLGFGGVSIAHVGQALRIPTLAVYDSDTAGLQTRLAWPFVTHLIVPEDYDGPVPAGRTSRLAGTKDFSHFHPLAFRPDRNRAIDLGLDPARRNLFLRVVRWGANHDVGKRGWSESEAEALVRNLPSDVKLHVSSEGAPPEAFRPYIWRGPSSEVHHVLGYCDAYVGESATMACEAAVLGVPALYAGVDFPGYVRGLARRGLLKLIAPEERVRLPGEIDRLLVADPNHREAHRNWLASCPDWSEAVVAKAHELMAAGRNASPRSGLSTHHNRDGQHHQPEHSDATLH